MIELRKYQKEIVDKASDIINQHQIVYLSMQVRTGKTLTSLSICEKIGAKNVFFVTKKKVVDGIYEDYQNLGCKYNFHCVNYESLHKTAINVCDVLICDEAHTLGAFPKPSKRTKQLKDFVSKFKCKVIFLSGTPSPESYSQMYHQFYISPFSPFRNYVNFYRWANDYVKIKTKYIGSMQVKDYSGAIMDKVMGTIKHLMISFTQEEANFESVINEHFIKVLLEESTYALCDKLKKDLVIKGKNDLIVADTGAKLMNKLHQMYSGTIITESGNRVVIDTTKAVVIKSKFDTEKVGIFYKFKAEYDALKSVFEDELTDNLDEFNNNDKRVIALQIQSGREGISLRKADVLVYYNIDFSAVSYWQSRDRMTTIDRKENNVYWIFADKGIEEKIYRIVSEKKDYTLNHFRKDFLN